MYNALNKKVNFNLVLNVLLSSDNIFKTSH
jgi:hypothetical protein